MRGRYSLLGVVLVGLSAGPGRAGEHTDPANHFTLDLPKNWVAFPPRELKAFNAVIDRAHPGLDIVFAAGFRSSTQRSGPPACILVQIDTEVTPGFTFDDLVAELTRDHEAAKKDDRDAQIRLRRRMLDPAGKLKVDKERKRFSWLPADDVFVSSELYWSGSYGIVGPDRVVLLHTLGGAGDKQKYAKMYAKTADSFTLDEAGPAADARPMLERMITTPTGEIARPVVIGGGVALAVLVVGALVVAQQRGQQPRGRPWG